MNSALFNDNVFEFIKVFLVWVEVFFVAYLVGYSSFLFLAVVTGSTSLYKNRQREALKKCISKGSLYTDKHHRTCIQ